MKAQGSSFNLELAMRKSDGRCSQNQQLKIQPRNFSKGSPLLVNGKMFCCFFYCLHNFYKHSRFLHVVVHHYTMCFSGLVMLPSILSCHPMFKAKLKKFTSVVKTISMSVLLSQSYGYFIHIIPELCSKFHVVDVGFIMALLR